MFFYQHGFIMKTMESTIFEKRKRAWQIMYEQTRPSKIWNAGDYQHLFSTNLIWSDKIGQDSFIRIVCGSYPPDLVRFTLPSFIQNLTKSLKKWTNKIWSDFIIRSDRKSCMCKILQGLVRSVVRFFDLGLIKLPRWKSQT